MITELTKEQEALMDVVRDEWLAIGLHVEPEMNKPKAEGAVRQSYTCADLKEPDWVYYARSPKEGALTVAIIKNEVENNGAAKPPSAEFIAAEVEKLKAMDKLPEAISKLAQDAFQWACYGQHDAGWLSFYDYFERIGVEGLEQLAGLKNAAHHCGWWWPMERIAVISEKPIALHLDDQGRLHGPESKAIAYNDDWGLYVWHGVNVPGDIIEHPEDITAKRVQDEDNSEIRRIMIELMGEARFLEEANAKEIDKDEDELGLPRILYRIEFDDDDDAWQGVRVLNSSLEPDGSRSVYVIPVPPEMTSVKEALAWTFEMDADEYAPEQQS